MRVFAHRRRYRREMMDPGRGHFAARSLTAIHALAFEGEELRKAFDTDPRLGYAIMKRLLAVLAQRLEAAQRPLAAAAHGYWVEASGATM